MDVMDDRPLAVRRKRRASSALADPADKETTRQQIEEKTTTLDAPCEQPKTPGNRKKKTRFSDSVLEIGESSSAGALSSTGLTPAINRTLLIPVKSTDKVKKRLSLPLQLMKPAASRSSTGSPLSAGPVEVQFKPLRQVIDPRTMRKLKRNHLSETTNEIYAEKKSSKTALQQEINDLRSELALARRKESNANDTGNDTGNATDMTHENSTRIVELEEEISNLKQEMREQSVAVNPSNPEASTNRSSVSSPAPFDIDDSESIMQHADNAIDLTGGESLSEPPMSEASTQTSLISPTISEMLRSARLEYEHLFPGETAIGLEATDPVPFIQAMITRVESLKKKIDRLGKDIPVVETSRINMKNQFDSALHQLEHHRKSIKTMKSKIGEEKSRADTAELEIATLEVRVENAESKHDKTKKERDDHQRSIERLQPALEHYQDEVAKLTREVLKMEASHEDSMAKLRLDYETSNRVALAARDIFFSDTISDLEAQIAAETTGRRKAEESAVERLNRLKVLENREAELQAAVHEKQSIIRQLETEIRQNLFLHANEVGQLNVRIGELSSNISSTNAELTIVRQETSRLSQLVEQEKAAGLKAVESMQSEVKKCVNNVDAVKDDHTEGVKKRGDEVAQSFGLITPVVDGGRFRDAEADEKVDGHVELMRGKPSKSRPDSGIGLWGTSIEEEIENGDIVMDDAGMAAGMGIEDYPWTM
ncbi:MAG: hypothetical protein L6R40_000355 [Gallowayella cf. fulva]|nr:MAG: hypothetical protein L6R40_000355 [Xanthomendoza cf. fulva]